MTRQTKTPRQRAEDTLAAAQRRYTRAIKTRDKASEAAAHAELEVGDAQARLNYAKQDPALANPADPLDPTIAPGGTTE
jgi:hypothetical protein